MFSPISTILLKFAELKEGYLERSSLHSLQGSLILSSNGDKELLRRVASYSFPVPLEFELLILGGAVGQRSL